MRITCKLACVTASEIPSLFTHPTAIVEPGSRVGEGTSIWHHAQVRQGAVIGADCTLGKNVFVDEGVIIGNRVKIQNNVSVYKGAEIDDEVFIGPSVVFTNDLRPRAANGNWQLGSIRVCRGASLGANATIVCGVEIGEGAMVGAGAVVTASVRPHELVVGNPARHHGWVCACGDVVSRAEEPPADLRCPQCRQDAGPALAQDAGPASGPGAGQVPAQDAARPRIPLVKVVLGAEAEEAVLSVLRSGHLASGPWVEEFEASFARAHRAAHAIAVCNGTAALVAALRAHHIGPGDEVITSPLTFVATLNSILEVGATARFADVTDDLTIDPSAPAALINPRTKALMPVHLYGLPAAMPEILTIARQHGLVVIEDAAQAHGARVGDEHVGSFDTATFSLYATKNITCGEGGVVTTSDDEVAARLRLLRNHGMRARYDYSMPGTNYRLTDIQAAIAVTQLRKLPGIVAARNRHAALLSVGLAGLPGLVLPERPADRLHVWHQYTVQVTSEARIDREQLSKCLAAEGIDSMAYYPRLAHDYPCFRDHPQVARDETPRARRAAAEVLSLPVHPALTADDLGRVVSCVRASLTQ
jgi:dTDP-4-amino-4,6-dideoxygalactose transaminase/acetyltransferase-like isoleucine patch superfamily enzyme